jgi:hypothetical protein
MERGSVLAGDSVRLWLLQLLRGTAIFPLIANIWHEVRVYVAAGLTNSPEGDCLCKKELSASRGVLSRDCDWNSIQEMHGSNIGVVTVFYY